MSGSQIGRFIRHLWEDSESPYLTPIQRKAMKDRIQAWIKTPTPVIALAASALRGFITPPEGDLGIIPAPASQDQAFAEYEPEQAIQRAINSVPALVRIYSK